MSAYHDYVPINLIERNAHHRHDESRKLDESDRPRRVWITQPLEPRETETLEVEDAKVLIRVYAAGLNLVDWHFSERINQRDSAGISLS